MLHVPLIFFGMPNLAVLQKIQFLASVTADVGLGIFREILVRGHWPCWNYFLNWPASLLSLPAYPLKKKPNPKPIIMVAF